MKILGVIIGVLLVITAAFVVIVVQPGTSGTVASLSVDDGSEYRVTQRCNWSAEPYTVAFYMRSPGGRWGWCYMDHQANRWWDVAMTYDATADVVTVTKRGVWQAALDRRRGTFALGDGKPSREVTAPQEYLEPGFSPP